MRIAAFALTLALIPTFSAGADDTTDKALAPFQGTWAVVSITQNGTAAAEETVKELTLHVKGNERLVKVGDEVKSRGTFTVDATKSPKTIDLTVTEGPLAGKTLKGIYELKDGTMTLCLTTTGEGRPDDLTAKEDSGRLPQVFRRIDPKDVPAKPPVKDPALREEFLKRMKAEQAGRVKLTELAKANGGKLDATVAGFTDLVHELETIDTANTAWVKGVIEKHGWPGFALVGKDGEQAAFLLVQHADRDREFQKTCLAPLEAAVKAKDASPGHLAYLTDRVLVGAGEKQKFGTQIIHQGDDLVPAPIEDEANVDARRKAVGLPPLAADLETVRRNQGVTKK